MNLCICGCGTQIKDGLKWSIGHQNRGVNGFNKEKYEAKFIIQKCNCHCGNDAPLGKKYIHGHHARGENNSMKREEVKAKRRGENNSNYKPELHVVRVPHLCDCGCGKQTKIIPNTNKRLGHVKGEYYKFVHGHNMVGRKAWNKGLTKEDNKFVMKISNSLIGKTKGIKKSEETILKMKQHHWTKKQDAEGIKKKIYTDKWIEDRSLDKCYFWQGGKSFEPYTPDFNKKIKQKIKKRDGCCMLCNTNLVILKELKRQIHIHHVDYDKLNSFPQNLITLCNNCHMLTNRNREHWTTFFQNILKQLYKYQYSEDQKIILDFNGGNENGNSY